jgi:thioredoxin-related protein
MNLILLLTAHLYFQTNSIPSDSTIVFRNVKYSEVFVLAKTENKPILLYFHFNGCSGCITMEKTTFINKEIVEFVNKNFICYSVNISYQEGKETNEIYNIKGFPTFLFLDFKGNIIHEVIGLRPPDYFIQEARKALELSNYPRSIALFEYAIISFKLHSP